MKDRYHINLISGSKIGKGSKGKGAKGGRKTAPIRGKKGK